MPLIHRALDFSIQLGKGSFGESGFDTVDLSGHRASAVITKNGIPAMNSATIRIYGMTLSMMNQLSRIGTVPTAIRDNIVTIKAGSGGQDMALAFAGGIKEAWTDFVGAPDVAFNITAFTGLLGQMKKSLPSSYTGSTDVATIMGDLAKKMGYTLENNNVQVKLSNPYLPGTARMQAIATADAADIYVVFDDDKHIMAILPKTGSRQGTAPLIAPPPAGGMIGYPSYVGPGQIGLRTVYNPSIRFMGNVQVQSSVTPANGQWRVTSLVHNLESEVPNGSWYSDIRGNLLLAEAQ